jgi:Spy/CpxP family protein refolding chaperone
MSVKKRLGFLTTGLLVCMLTMPVLAQNNGGGGGDQGGGGNGGQGQNGGGGGGGGGGGRQRNFDPQQFQQMFMNRIKDALGASDDEFAAIQPKLQTVMTLQNDVTPRMRGMFGNRPGRNGGPGGGGPGGGFGGPGASTQPSEVRTAMTDLQNTLNDQNASPDEIKSKLDAVRQARTKEKQDLVVAQQDLKSVLTQRQEAVLVVMGLLD